MKADVSVVRQAGRAGAATRRVPSGVLAGPGGTAAIPYTWPVNLTDKVALTIPSGWTLGAPPPEPA